MSISGISNDFRTLPKMLDDFCTLPKILQDVLMISKGCPMLPFTGLHLYFGWKLNSFFMFMVNELVVQNCESGARNNYCPVCV